ncbi:MAG: HIT family protein [Candidatus Saccharimonadales bacterium]
MHHYRKTVKKYWDRQKVSECPFCDSVTLGRAIKETKHAYIVFNLTFYDVWEGHDVSDHLLVVPKRHVKSMKELTEPERLDIIDLIADYESHDYSAYARGVGNVVRSVEHQHTHLIKIHHKRPKFSIYLRKPYFLIKF